MADLVKLVVFVPEENAEDVRQALGDAGAGRIGDYSYCSFSARGTGRFLPGEAANPNIGRTGRLEAVAEERIETVCERALVASVVESVKRVHPYEEVVIDVYPLISP